MVGKFWEGRGWGEGWGRIGGNRGRGNVILLGRRISILMQFVF
jgi:hypothetical protein